jgi:hypothetical protein
MFFRRSCKAKLSFLNIFDVIIPLKYSLTYSTTVKVLSKLSLISRVLDSHKFRIITGILPNCYSLSWEKNENMFNMYDLYISFPSSMFARRAKHSSTGYSSGQVVRQG